MKLWPWKKITNYQFSGRFLSLLKVMLKAKIAQILFLQIHQNYAKHTFETFTVDGIAIAYQKDSI